MTRVVTALILAALWLLMSGIYKPMVIGFGAVSVILVTLVISRMNAVDGDHVKMRLKPVGYVLYLVWLLVEIAKANWAVTKVILSPDMLLRQHLFATPTSQKTDLGQVIFANSITLTPGTITVETEPDRFLVHAISFSDADLEALEDMDRRVSATETGGPV